MHWCNEEWAMLIAAFPFLGYGVLCVRGWLGRARAAWRAYLGAPSAHAHACCPRRRGHPGEP